MSQALPSSHSGRIDIDVSVDATGHCTCELTPQLGERPGETRRFHGQNPKHALAIALECLAGALRREAETEQGVDWDAVARSPSGGIAAKRFHVILHYERTAEEESKFEAMHNTLIGNTVVENAEITIIQVDPDLPIDAWSKGGG